MKRVLVVMVVAALGAIGLIQAPAIGATGATCAAKAGVTLSPGISMTASSGTFKSKPGGTLACAGTVKGTNVGGTGTLTFSGVYGTNGGDTCASGAGSGKLTAVLPKVGGGTIKVAGTFTFKRAGSDVVIQGTLSGATLGANLQFVPDQGQNCAQTKVVSAIVAGPAVVGGSS